MRPAFQVHPEAAEELDAAIAWYDQGGQNRGVAFEAAVNGIIDRCLEWPGSAAVVPVPGSERDFRHARVPRSHYRVVYYIADDILTVVAIAHERRLPLYWADRR